MLPCPGTVYVTKTHRAWTVTCLMVSVLPVHPKISSLNPQPSPGLDAGPSPWLPSPIVLLSFIFQTVQCLEWCCQATGQTASLRLRIQSYNTKGKTDCLVRPVSNTGHFPSPLYHGSISKVIRNKQLESPLSLTTTLSPRKEREGGDSKAT